ncbi:hypothetical protein H6771_01850 [Candidatus Peribacteria bacterium]|nr:hypothetical protein [Candidatus Peribacteria bacterium]
MKQYFSLASLLVLLSHIVTPAVVVTALSTGTATAQVVVDSTPAEDPTPSPDSSAPSAEESAAVEEDTAVVGEAPSTDPSATPVEEEGSAVVEDAAVTAPDTDTTTDTEITEDTTTEVTAPTEELLLAEAPVTEDIVSPLAGSEEPAAAAAAAHTPSTPPAVEDGIAWYPAESTDYTEYTAETIEAAIKATVEAMQAVNLTFEETDAAELDALNVQLEALKLAEIKLRLTESDVVRVDNAVLVPPVEEPVVEAAPAIDPLALVARVADPVLAVEPPTSTEVIDCNTDTSVYFSHRNTAGGNDTLLATISTDNVVTDLLNIGGGGYILNALALNAEDGLFYSIRGSNTNDGPNTVVVFDAAGTILLEQNVGLPTGAAAGGVNNGVIDPVQKLYLVGTGQDPQTLHFIDIDPLSPTYMTIIAAKQATVDPKSVQDYAYNDDDGMIYGFNVWRTNAGNWRGRVVQIDASTTPATVTYFPTLNLPNNIGYPGAAFFGTDGLFYVRFPDRLYYLDVTNPNGGMTRVGAANDATMNGYDAAQCFAVVAGGVATMTLEKTAVFNDENGDGLASVGETITYTYTVENTALPTIYNVVVTEEAGSFLHGYRHVASTSLRLWRI